MLAPLLQFCSKSASTDRDPSRTQPLLLGSALMPLGFTILVLGLFADLIACNGPSRNRRGQMNSPRRGECQQHELTEYAVGKSCPEANRQLIAWQNVP